VTIENQRAYCASEKEDYEQALLILQGTKRHIDQIAKDTQTAHLITYYEALGLNYLGIGDYMKAKVSFQSALRFEEQGQHVSMPRLYMGMGELAMHEQDFVGALAHFNKADSFLVSNPDV